jgi:steroid 5-alpha reductase family enzyme
MSVFKFLTATAISLGITQLLAFVASNPSSTRLYQLGLLAILIQWVVFLVHASGKLFGNKPTEKYYDLTGAITYLLLSIYSYRYIPGRDPTVRQRLLTGCVLLWCVRLGFFLFNRICRAGGVDSRFNGRRDNFFGFWTMWTIQVAATVSSVCHYSFNVLVVCRGYGYS